MSQLLSPTVTHPEPFEPAPASRAAWIRWPKWILLLLALLWVADAGISLLILHSRLRGKLTNRLEAAFGRPVEVGSYDFSLWDGPALEAQSVTVAEDPRFGHEYFLHAESLTVRLLWTSLLRGRIGLGTLSLTRPSLNLVRDPNGNWNISEWLPRPAGTAPPPAPTGIGPRLVSRALSFSRIEINAGRINFKRGDEKLPYAFSDVTGTVEVEGQSRWRMDLEAAPWRAATGLQQAGMLHLVGDVGGTSSRLLPAALQLSWTDASLQDVLRLARGDDSGLRGTLALFAVVSTQGENWNLQARTELRVLHRWDLALRADNPAVNIIAKMQWNPHVPALALSDATIEGPHSNAHVAGTIQWGRPLPRLKPISTNGEVGTGSDDAQVQVLSSSIDLRDLLSWVRAFRSDISDDLNVRGVVSVQASAQGWPPRLDEGSLTTDGADLSAASLRVPVHLSPAAIHYAKNVFGLSTPAILSFGADPGVSALHIDGATAWGVPPGRKSANPPSHLNVTGKIAQVRDLIATASLLGWNLSRGWDVAGPIRADLQWQGGQFPWQAQPKGFIEWGLPAAPANSASLRAPFLNLPIGQIAARVDFKPGATHITLTSAQAFGALWSGTFDHRDGDRGDDNRNIHDRNAHASRDRARSGQDRSDEPDGWRFDLSADQLAASDLNAWLNPLSRENFLDRMLPFLNGRSQSIAVPEGLRATGHLTVDKFTLAPLVVRSLEGDLALDARHVTFANASGQLSGGIVAGAVEADLQSVPAYRVTLDFSHVNLTDVTGASPTLATLTADSASGSASFETRGATRGDLLAALTCDGKASVNDLGLSNIDLLSPLRAGETQRGTSTFETASAAFSCTNSQIDFTDLQLDGSGIRLGGSGTVDFNRNLDLRLRVLSDDAVGPRLEASPASTGQLYQLTGTLVSPQVAQVQTTPARRVR
jgi:uncharacterized protein involved in outer membrane biogenesis